MQFNFVVIRCFHVIFIIKCIESVNQSNFRRRLDNSNDDLNSGLISIVYLQSEIQCTAWCERSDVCSTVWYESVNINSESIDINPESIDSLSYKCSFWNGMNGQPVSGHNVKVAKKSYSNHCANNGVIIENIGICQCPDGYQGDFCEIDCCLAITCLNHGVCNGIAGEYTFPSVGCSYFCIWPYQGQHANVRYIEPQKNARSTFSIHIIFEMY